MEHLPVVFLPFSVLPEGQEWTVGKAYRIKAVLRQTSKSEDGASFEVVDANSLELEDKGKRIFLSDGGMFKG